MCDDETAQYHDAPRNQSTLTGCVSKVWHKAKTVFLLSMTADALPVEVVVFHLDVMTIYLNKMIIFKPVGKKVLICPPVEPQLAKTLFYLFGIESRSDPQRDPIHPDGVTGQTVRFGGFGCQRGKTGSVTLGNHQHPVRVGGHETPHGDRLMGTGLMKTVIGHRKHASRLKQQ